VGLLVWGFFNADGLSLAAEDGLGYALGIAGLACMILLLGYSIRKRVGLLRHAGPMSRWLEIHLILGLLGPTAILYHSRFEFGSRNATIAMACMLLVAGSGVGGRFVYGKLHRGLAGPRRTAESLRKDALRHLAPLQTLLDEAPAARRILEGFESFAFGPLPWGHRISRVLILRPFSWLERRRVARALRRSRKDGSKLRRRAVRRVLRQVFTAQCRAVELQVYERIFALWHALHVPLCVILFVSAAIHVLAVHLY
jgi:hypothetical protein